MTVNQAPARAWRRTARNPWHWPVPRDPGDLSRRLAARRAELRLSLSQVAERAAVNRRYLEYLENFPGQPGARTLRQLAAALRTTPGALLGAGQEAPPGRAPAQVVLGLGRTAQRLFPRSATGCSARKGSAGSPSAPRPGWRSCR